MAANPESLRITDAYRLYLSALGQRTAAAIAAPWLSFDPTDLRQSVGLWLPSAEMTLRLGQSEAVRATDAYLSHFLSSELGEDVAPVGLDVGQYAGTTVAGGAIGDALRSTLVHSLMSIGQGNDVQSALAVGAQWAARISDREVKGAARASLSDAMRSDDRIIGWERVTSDDPCGACLGLADEGLRATDEGLEIHDNCSCVAEPVVGHVEQDAPRDSGADTFDSLDEEQQDALFAGRGGAEVASLLRAGDISFSDLVTRSEWGGVTWVYQTPLSDLTD